MSVAKCKLELLLQALPVYDWTTSIFWLFSAVARGGAAPSPPNNHGEKKILIDEFPILELVHKNLVHFQRFQEWKFQKFSGVFPPDPLGFARPCWAPQNILPSYGTAILFCYTITLHPFKLYQRQDKIVMILLATPSIKVKLEYRHIVENDPRILQVFIFPYPNIFIPDTRY